MRYWYFAASFLGTLLFDRLTKYWAYHTLAYDPIAVCTGLNFDMSWNKGVTWSLLTPDTHIGFWMLTGVIIALNIGLMIMIGMRLRTGSATVFEFILLAGAMSNVCDRFMYGAVLDFIQLYWRDWYFPTFNIADAAIDCGVIGMFLHSWWRQNHD